MFRSALQRIRRVVVKTSVGGVVVLGGLEVTTHLPSQGRSSKFYHDLADEWVTPAFRSLDPERAHYAAILAAQLGISPTVRLSAKEQRCKVGQTLFGNIHFPNPVGLAAGFDKDGQVIQEMLDVGFGFVEIGTVTPKPQPGNPKPRMFRLPEDFGIINRYGFNSAGADEVERNVWKFRNPNIDSQDDTWWKLTYEILFPVRHRTGPLGINIGKNKTSADAVDDYLKGIRQLSPLADYIVINISSPNTAGLRDLQETDALRDLLSRCLETRDSLARRVPLLVKLAPDLDDEELKSVAKVCTDVHVDGIVVTNTTNQRPKDLSGRHRGESGGLSGQPVKQRSNECIRLLYRATDGNIPIIGVGGIGDGKDAYDKLKAGASIVQIYSMMVYQGPGVVSRIRDELANLMLQNGQRSIQEVIGSDHEDVFWRKREERLEKNS